MIWTVLIKNSKGGPVTTTAKGHKKLHALRNNCSSGLRYVNIAYAMTRNRYQRLSQFSHFVNN